MKSKDFILNTEDFTTEESKQDFFTSFIIIFR